MHIGISAYFHDSSIALIDNQGNLVDFKKEEWLSRVKGDKSFPRMALNDVLDANQLDASMIESITFYEKPLRAWLTILKYSVRNNSLRNELTRNYFKNIWKSSIIFRYDLMKHLSDATMPIFYSDHYLSHTLSGLFYAEQGSYAAIVADGFGDSDCSAIHHVRSTTDIRTVWASPYPNSLGLFYSAITDYLGFLVNEGEYKVMGLASYGAPVFYEELKKTLNFYDNQLIVDTSYYDYTRSVEQSFSEKLVTLLKTPARKSNVHLDLDSPNFQKYADIAASAQKLVENLLIEIFQHAHNITGERKFIFTGGVAMNSVALEKLSKCAFIDEIIVPPSPGDSGAAIGAAYYGYLKEAKNPQKQEKFRLAENLFPGKVDQNEDFFTLKLKKISEPEDAIEKVAELISQNEVIATAYGDIETGPRALGHRSMICNAHSEETIKFLNTVIKSRSKFRPTAPVILESNAKKYFHISEKIKSCYSHMGAVTTPLDEVVESIKGVVHVDGTCRIQTCNESQLLGKILKELSKRDIFVIANTSFNISSDPMVYSKEDALLSIERMQIKYLLTENGLYERSS
jgi:carbamoyltransferase